MKEEKEGARVNLFENFYPYIYFVNGLIVFSRLFLSSFLFEGSIEDSKEKLLKILGNMDSYLSLHRRPSDSMYLILCHV